MLKTDRMCKCRANVNLHPVLLCVVYTTTTESRRLFAFLVEETQSLLPSSLSMTSSRQNGNRVRRCYTNDTSHKIVGVNGTVYVVGGRNLNRNIPFVEKYDRKRKKWRVSCRLDYPVHDFACVKCRDVIYIFGGRNDNGENIFLIQSIDTRTATAAVCGYMPYECNGGSAEVINDAIYYFFKPTDTLWFSNRKRIQRTHCRHFRQKIRHLHTLKITLSMLCSVETSDQIDSTCTAQTRTSGTRRRILLFQDSPQCLASALSKYQPMSNTDHLLTD